MEAFRCKKLLCRIMQSCDLNRYTVVKTDKIAQDKECYITYQVTIYHITCKLIEHCLYKNMHSPSGVDEENEVTLNMSGTFKGESGIQNSFLSSKTSLRGILVNYFDTVTAFTATEKLSTPTSVILYQYGVLTFPG